MRGFIHARFTVEGDSAQLMCIESRLKEGLTSAQRADFGVDDDDGMTVTIMNRMVTSVYLSVLHSQIVSQPRKLIARMIQEFERYANVEILEFVDTVICQTEWNLMEVERLNKPTMFLDDETEMAGAETKPNEVGMECDQTYSTLRCGRAKA